MGSITIMLGRSRWRRRRALPDQALSGVDALGRPDFLYLAASAAKRRAVERDFLDFRSDKPCFAPTVRVFDELADDLWIRHGDGMALLTHAAAEYLAHDLLVDSAGRWPWLARAGRPRTVARALVQYRNALDAAGRLSAPPADVPHGAEIMDALRSLETRLRDLPGHIPRTVALRRLIDIMQAPSPAVIRQLRTARTVILDDLLQPPPLQRALLVALCRAWESAGSHVVIGLETGRDLGGREVGMFFEYDDVDDVAYALRPFRATRSLRRTLFEELVASGEAELWLALRDRVVPIEPGVPLAEPEAPDLSDHLYGPRPVQLGGAPATDLLGDTVQIVCHDTADDELAHTAASVKQAIREGAEPKACMVALPGLADRADSVRSVFAAHGVPVRLTRSGSLASSPVAIVALRVAQLAVDGFPADAILALLSSDLVETPADIDIPSLARSVRAAGIRSGLPSTWLGALRAWAARQVSRAMHPGPTLEADLAALDAVVAPLDALARPMAPQAWSHALLRQLGRLQVPERAGAGPLDHGTLDAWGGLLTVLEQLVRDQQVAGVRDLPAAVLTERFELEIQATPLPSPTRRGGEVEILDLDDLLGLTPRHLWVLGLTRSAWPRSRPSSFLVPDEVMRGLEAPRPAESARYLFSSLLRNALDDREIQTLALSWHASDGGRTTAPSPLLEDLLVLPTDSPMPGDSDARAALLRDLIPLRPAERAPTGIGAVLASAAAEPGWRALAPAEHHPHLATQARVYRARRQPVPGAWEGVLERPPESPPQRIAVTRMETFLRCPARFWYAHTLGLGRADAEDPDITAHRKGNVLHAILESFVGTRLGRPVSGDVGILSAELHRVASRALDEVAASGGVEPALLGHLRDEWLSGLLDDAPHGILRAWLELEVSQASERMPIAVETRQSLDLGEITLTAGLDRVDRTRSGSLVLDYKTGAAPKASMVKAGLALQPVAYAAIRAEQDPSRPVAAAYVSLKAADQVRPVGFVGDPGVLDEIGASRRSRLDLSTADRDTLLDHARQAAVRLRAGLAHTTLTEPAKAGCRYCDFARICRVSPARSAQLSDSSADLQRPIPPADPGDAA